MLTNRRVLIVIVALLLSGCGSNAAQKQTVPGPETANLLPATTGWLVRQEGAGDIVADALPSLHEAIVRPSARPGDIHALSGPDSQGRIAYIENHFFDSDEKHQHHLLKTIRLDGIGDTEIFSRPGDAMWAESAAGHGEIGKTLALSPRGGHVAFLSELSEVQMPAALLYCGQVEIWDVVKKTGSISGIRALDEGLAWFPDGRRLAYVKLIDAKQAVGIPNTDLFGQYFRKWEKVPAVFIRDTSAGTDALVHVGVQPVVSFDGQSVLMTDFDGHWKLVDVATGKSIDVSWPGMYGNIVASVSDGVVLAWCLPTQGTKVELTKYYSPLVGPREMLTLKLAQLNSSHSQTVVPSIDPRATATVSFGRAEWPTTSK